MQFAKTKTGDAHFIDILPQLANRHGLIAGATGTGKTVTLQTLAELFSREGVPVFMADVKGDLSGMGAAGVASDRIKARLDLLGLNDFDFAPCPVMFWDVYGKKGHPVRSTLSEIGPQLLGRLMNLNDTQSSVLMILFRIADEAGLLLLDLKDMNALIGLVQENLDKFKPQYGHLSPASLGIIQRGLITLENEGAKDFFGEPAFNVMDLLQTDNAGRGIVSILAADKLLLSPVVYSTFLLWMLSELYETLPEVGDQPKPKLVFFFDEAHLLFRDTPKPLVEKIEQVVRLVRSKGVGIYFVTQNPSDIPPAILGQLAHRVQHALRAFTPIDKKAVDTAADTMRPNPAFKTSQVITELGVGEALVSVLDAKGTPTMVEQCYICPPHSRIGPLTDDERASVIAQSPVAGFYEQAIDRESAFEVLQAQQQKSAPPPAPAPTTTTTSGGWGSKHETPKTSSPPAPTTTGGGSVLNEIIFGSTGPRGGRKPGLIEKAATSATRSMATSVGREIMRGLLGSLMGGSGRKR
ncbi:MAG: DUF853 family protein [bacterium]|nr:DUF853 family protein [bacterium]